MPILLGLIVIIVVLFLLDGWYTVPQKNIAMLTRFGKYTGLPKTAGLKFKYPIIDRVHKISIALQQIPANLSTKTRDDQFVVLPISIQFYVRNTERYYFNTTDPNDQITNIITAEVRKYTSQKDFQELYDERQEISDSVKESVATDLADYGVIIVRIVIDEPQPDKDTKEAYNSVKASERHLEAARNNAEAEYVHTVKMAEADAKRNELIGEGVKSFRKSIAQSYIETRQSLMEAGVDEDAADIFMTEAMRLDTMRDVGEKGNLVLVALDNNGVDNSIMPQTIAALKATEMEAKNQKKKIT
jgi:regulator of protease activity HflC (stomatin/prohibitin superfamily)